MVIIVYFLWTKRVDHWEIVNHLPWVTWSGFNPMWLLPWRSGTMGKVCLCWETVQCRCAGNKSVVMGTFMVTGFKTVVVPTSRTRSNWGYKRFCVFQTLLGMFQAEANNFPTHSMLGRGRSSVTLRQQEQWQSKSRLHDQWSATMCSFW